MRLREAAQQVLDCARWVNDEQAIVPYEQMINLRIMLENVVQAEPVAWMRADRGHVDFHRHLDYLPLYTTAPPKRQPLTEQELEPIRRRMMMEAYNAADDGDSERYNALKVMANDVLDMLLGGEK